MSTVRFDTCRQFFGSRSQISLIAILGLLMGTVSLHAQTAPSTYSAYTGTDAKAIPAAPALGAANTVINDPTFGTPILRVTDPNTNGGESFVSTDSGFTRAWNADSTAFKLTGPHGDGWWMEFNASTFKVGDGSAKPVPHQMPYGATWNWSAADPNLMYVLHGSKIATYNKATGATTDLAGPSTGEPVAYGAVVIGQDNWVCSAVGSGGQDTYTKIFCVNPSSPGTSKFIDVLNKTINGVAQGDPNWPQSASGSTLGIHDVSGGTGANWLEVTFHGVNWGANGGAVLDLATNTWSKVTNADIYWSGHTSMGNGLYANSSGSQDGKDSRGMVLRNPDNLMNSSQYKFVGQPAVTNNGWCDADHISWLNSMSNPNAPILVSRYMANVPNCAVELTGEIYAAAVDGSGTIYRFAHNHDGGCYYGEGFAQISNDGNWALFSSYWDGTLGSDTSFGCTTRIDTFILKLTGGAGSSSSGTSSGSSGGTSSGTSSSGSTSGSGSTSTGTSTGTSSGSTTGSSTGSSTGSTSTSSNTGTSSGSTTTAPNSVITRYEQTSNTITYSGSWSTNSNSMESGGSAVMAATAGASATFSFSGTGANWIGFSDEYSGIANVYVDGVLKGQVDTYHSPTQYQKLQYSITGLAAGNHTLKIEAAGTKNASSGGAWVWLDAFDAIAGATTSASTPTSGSGTSTGSTTGTTTGSTTGSTGTSSGSTSGTTTGSTTGTSSGSTTGTTSGSTTGTTTGTTTGSTGGTTSKPTNTTTRFEQTSSAVTYSGSWSKNSNSMESGGSAVLSGTTGASATFSFKGTGADWIGFSDEYSGIANVYVDGVLKGQIDTYHSPTQYKKMQYSITGLAAGNHTLKIEVSGKKNAASGGAWVWVDAFDAIN